MANIKILDHMIQLNKLQKHTTQKLLNYLTSKKYIYFIYISLRIYLCFGVASLLHSSTLVIVAPLDTSRSPPLLL